jgi:hypothetical protein
MKAYRRVEVKLHQSLTFSLCGDADGEFRPRLHNLSRKILSLSWSVWTEVNFLKA